MDGVVVDAEYVEKPAQPAVKPNGHTKGVPEMLVDAGICENIPAAATLLNKYIPKEIRTNGDKAVAWGKIYRAWRDMGADIEPAVTNATEGIIPK